MPPDILKKTRYKTIHAIKMEALTVEENHQLYQNTLGKCLLFVSVLFVLSVVACGPSQELKNLAISTAKEAIKKGHPAVEIREVRIKNYAKMNLDTADPLNGITEKWIFNITYAWIDTTDNNVSIGDLEVPIYKKNGKYIASF
jgi:hypothetical protein